MHLNLRALLGRCCFYPYFTPEETQSTGAELGFQWTQPSGLQGLHLTFPGV